MTQENCETSKKKVQNDSKKDSCIVLISEWEKYDIRTISLLQDMHREYTKRIIERSIARSRIVRDIFKIPFRHNWLFVNNGFSERNFKTGDAISIQCEKLSFGSVKILSTYGWYH